MTEEKKYDINKTQRTETATTTISFANVSTNNTTMMSLPGGDG